MMKQMHNLIKPRSTKYLLNYLLSTKLAIVGILGVVLYMFPKAVEKNASLLNINKYLGILLPFDANWFYLLAKNGYQHPKHYAFFEGYPYLLRLLTTHLDDEKAILIGATINVLLSILSGILLFYIVSHMLTKNKGYVATILFGLSPAAVYYICLYSESVFFFVTVLGIFLIQRGYRVLGSDVLASTLLFRSNGIVNIGVIAYPLLMTLTDLRKNKKSIINIFEAFLKIVVLLTIVGVSLLYFYSQYIKYNYGAIQEKYWKTGFLKFLERDNSQILVSVPNLITYSIILLYSLKIFNEVTILKAESNILEEHTSFIIILYLHFIGNLLLVLLFGNTEINTRIISTCPYLYVATAYIVMNSKFKFFVIPVNIIYLFLNIFLVTFNIGFV